MRLEIDSSFLRTRVGRRTLAVVSLCALAPVVSFALFAHDRVSRQLEVEAIRSLVRESKARGMTILERLLIQETALAREPAGGESGVAQSLPPDLSALQRQRLESAQPILFVQRDGGFPVILMAIARDPGDVEGSLQVREIEAEALFSGLRESTEHFRVVDSTGSILSSAGSSAGGELLFGESSLFLRPSFGASSWKIRIGRPAEVAYLALRDFEAIFPWIAAATLLFALGLSAWQIRRTLEPIVALTEGARRIAARDYTVQLEVVGRDEFGELSLSFNEMSREIGEHVQLLSLLNRVGSALSTERDTGRLSELLLEGALELTGADGGAVYRVGEDGRPQIERSRLTGALFDPPLAEAQPPIGLIERCLGQRSGAQTQDLAGLAPEERELWSPLEARLPRPVSAYLSIPLRDEALESLGVLLLLRCGEGGFDGRRVAAAESLAAQAAVAIRKSNLVESFRGLFEGLIGLTVNAIDRKSAYTGDHCRKVPIITDMIADAVCEDESGPFRKVRLGDPERYELRIAALLHDCGKVVTPVHVMDKATKLETIVDRIALVEARVELLRRDRRLAALERRLEESGGGLGEEDEAALQQELGSLSEDFEFLRSCNVGSERMADESLERLGEIARTRRWVDREGEHRCVLEGDELENLSIRRGTLNPEERKVIEDHVVATMTMLGELPFPPEMRRVPAIAGAHHERMDGTGYPLRLRRDQLDVQSRILGLADVFEALTARDRPYKSGRSLRETLDILQAMSREGHIDPQLLELFVRDGLHLRYAALHMSPSQIDPEFHEAIEQITGP